MQTLRKVSITIFGGLLLLLGLIMIVLPGPAILIIPLALTILALEYQWAKHYLKISQRMLSQGGQRMDRWLRKLKRKH